MLATLKSQFTINQVMYVLGTVVILALMFIPDFAHAASAAGGGLPWESPLEKLKDSITGPVAIGISLIAITVSGAMLIFGGEINEFGRRMIMVVLVIAVIVFAAQVLSSLTGKSATIPVEDQQNSVVEKNTIHADTSKKNVVNKQG